MGREKNLTPNNPSPLSYPSHLLEKPELEGDSGEEPITTSKETFFTAEELELVSYLTMERGLSQGQDRKHLIDEILRHLELYSLKCYQFSKDPYIRTIGGVFETVFAEQLDPAEIDFSHFADIFMQRCVQDKEMDLSTISKLLLFAFKALNLKVQQKRAAIEALDRAEEEFDDFGDFSFEDMDIFQDEQGFEFTQRVVTNRTPPISESVRKGGDHTRRATLVELLQAIKDAEQERREYDRRYRKMQENRRIRRALQKKKRDEVVIAPVKDNIYEDIDAIWKTIYESDAQEMLFTQFLDDTQDSLSTVRSLFAVIAINQKGFVRLIQDQPFGDIRLTSINRTHEKISISKGGGGAPTDSTVQEGEVLAI